MVEDVVVGFEDAVREPIVAHELPDVLDRIELGRFRRQRQERDVVWDGKPPRDMPSRLIKKKDSVRAGRDRKRDFLQMKRHGFTVAGGEYEPGAFSFGRADGAENIGRTRPLVVRRRRPCPAFRPSAGDLVFLPDPSFVLKPNLYRLARSLFCGCLLHEGEKVFLKATAASSSCA